MSSALELPFSSIKPLKFIGLNQSKPFCSIISEGKLIYSAGSNIIMENSKTNEQKILFTNGYSADIELIHHHVTLYNEHLLAIALRDQVTLMHFIVIIPLNPIIFNEQNKKDKNFTHYLKNIEQFQTIKQIFFYEEGNLFAIVTEYEKMNNLSIYRSSVGEPIHQQTFFDAQIIINSTTVNKVNCLSLFDQRGKKQVSLCLMTLDELSRRFYLGFNLKQEEEIIQHHFQNYQDENILVVLANTGFILLLTFNEYEIKLVNRIDLKQPSKLACYDQRDSLKNKTKLSIKQTNQSHPSNIQSSSNKIIISYEEDCLIGILFYSHFDFKITKFILVKDAFNNIPLAKSISDFKIAKDNCTLAVLLQINPEKISNNSQETQNSLNSIATHQKIVTPQVIFQQQDFSAGRTPSLAQSYNSYNQLKDSNIQSLTEKQKKEYIAVQVDVLSNIIDHQEHACSTEVTFSAYSAHFKVIKAEYCRKNNSLFLLTANKILKYYDLNPKQANSKFQGSFTRYKDFKMQGLLLWQKALLNQANHITIHPFNYTILLIYDELLKFHYYNIKCLFPAFLITNIKNCTIAKYSPLGDKLIVATSGHIIALNSYTYEVIKTVSLPNIYTQSQLKRVSFVNPKKPASNPKLITDLTFLKNGDLLLFSGKNTFSMVLNYEKSSHFGFVEYQANEKYRQIIFDQTNNLIILLRKEDILILSKASINSKNKCEVVSKIEIKASSAYLLTQVNVLFIGCQDGGLFMINWPHYSQEDLYSQTNKKNFLFNDPIVSINISANLEYLYAVSKNGSFCICQLQVNEQRELSHHIKKILLSASDIQLRQSQRWLISRSQEERRQREIVKLRGEEVQSITNYTVKLEKQQRQNAQLIEENKMQLQANYIKQLKDYQNQLGLQCTIQQTALLSDELKTILAKKARQIRNENLQTEQTIKQIFEIRTALEQKLKLTKQSLQANLKSVRQDFNNHYYSFIKELDQNQVERANINSTFLQMQSSNQQHIRESISHLQQQRFQELNLLKFQHQEVIQNLLDLNQNSLGKTRNMNIGIHEMEDKIGSLAAEKQKLEYDMYKVLDERETYEEMRNQVAQQNEIVRKTYDRLMKQSKELEDKIQHQRKEHKCFQHNIRVIEQEVNFLFEHERSLQQKKLSLNTKFICEREENIRQDRQIANLQKKIQQLKLYKRQKSYDLSHKRSHFDQLVRSILRNIQTNEEQTVNCIIQQYKSNEQDQRIQSSINEEHQLLKAKHDKMAKDSIRWNQVKESYMNAFYRNNKKLEQQNLKLTYRYNDLLRLCQQYKSHAAHLKENIQKAKRNRMESKSLMRLADVKNEQARRPNLSFLIKSTSKKGNIDSKPYLKKKLICVTFHQDSGKFITQA